MIYIIPDHMFAAAETTARPAPEDEPMAASRHAKLHLEGALFGGAPMSCAQSALPYIRPCRGSNSAKGMAIRGCQ